MYGAITANISPTPLDSRRAVRPRRGRHDVERRIVGGETLAIGDLERQGEAERRAASCGVTPSG